MSSLSMSFLLANNAFKKLRTSMVLVVNDRIFPNAKLNKYNAKEKLLSFGSSISLE